MTSSRLDSSVCWGVFVSDKFDMLKRAFVVYFLLGWIGCFTDGLTHIMQDQCGQEFDELEKHGEYGGMINYTFTSDDEFSSSRSWDNCTLKFTSLGSKFAVSITHLRVYDCLTVDISVLEEDTDGNTRTLRGMPPDLCGTPTSIELGQVYVTEWSTLIVHIDGQNLKRVFSLSLTYNLFTDGPCNDDQYACDNGRCISPRLKCDGFNPCGDNSDCPDTDKVSTWTIVGIVIGAVFGVGILAVVIFCVILKIRRRDNDKSEVDQVKYDTDVASPGVDTVNVSGKFL